VTGQIGDKVKVFDGHPEHAVPASLRRFGRTVGVKLGAKDPAAISPAEARAVPRRHSDARRPAGPGGLRHPQRGNRTRAAVLRALMTGTWHPLELDFLLATTDRTASIVSGGSNWQNRSARQTESEACRAGLMASMLFNRLNNRDSAGDADGVRVLEDNRQGVEWHVDGDWASVEFTSLDAARPLPWCGLGPASQVRVFPRTVVTNGTWQRSAPRRTTAPCCCWSRGTVRRNCPPTFMSCDARTGSPSWTRPSKASS
jgi:hypothetical protein